MKWHDVLVRKNFHGLREACADAAFPYRTMTGLVKAFREGRGCLSGQPSYRTTARGNNTVRLFASLLDADRRWTARELATEVGICCKTVFLVLHDILGYRKLAAPWIPHEISEVQ